MQAITNTQNTIQGYVKGTPKVIANGITMTQLAGKMGVDVSTISRYFSGTRIPDFWTAMEMSIELNVTPTELATLLVGRV